MQIELLVNRLNCRLNLAVISPFVFSETKHLRDGGPQVLPGQVRRGAEEIHVRDHQQRLPLHQHRQQRVAADVPAAGEGKEGLQPRPGPVSAGWAPSAQADLIVSVFVQYMDSVDLVVVGSGYGDWRDQVVLGKL